MDGTNNQGPVFAPLPTDPLGGGIINAFLGLITKGVKNNKPQLKEMPGAFADIDENVFGKDLTTAFKAYNQKVEKADSALSSRDKEYKMDNPIAVLSKGKFAGVKLDKQVVDDLVNASRKYNINPIDLLAVIGQESTFAQEKKKLPSGEIFITRKPTQRDMSSGWDTDEPYEPYTVERYLADKQVPGVVPIDIGGKTQYSIRDIEKVREAVGKRPGLMQQYLKKLNKTPIAEENYFDMAARFIKEKGLKKYNPGDPKYVDKVMQSRALLQREPALMKYLQSMKYGKK